MENSEKIHIILLGFSQWEAAALSQWRERWILLRTMNGEI